MALSMSFVFGMIFLGFIGHSLYNLTVMFNAPVCPSGKRCYKSYLETNPSLDLHVFIVDNSRSKNIEKIFTRDNFNYREKLEIEIPVQLSKNVRNNGSMSIYTVILPHRKRSNTNLHEMIHAEYSTYIKDDLTQYAVPKSATFNLLNENAKGVRNDPVSHLKSKYGIVMCTELFEVAPESTPYEIVHLIRAVPGQLFLPIMDKDVMSSRLSDLQEITKETKETKFLFTYTPISVGKLRFFNQITMTLKQFVTWGFTDKDIDELKGVFSDTNLYLLCATMFIGSIHLFLDFLTFKNDVSFWKSQSSMAGLSSTGVFWRAISQTIVFLYLLDEKTSLLVLIPNGVGMIIEFWKVRKVLKRSGRNAATKEELETQKYESESLKYLSYLLYPLCIGGAIYSLMYQPHKSWYSWTINSLVNAVYAFGFIFMLPQLFINYRLKSVAALPWRAFTYRAFNTFIDDIFAFIITMPMAHRVACFRDDVVFLIYLYQRWLYPVDKNRIDDVTGTSSIREEKEKKKN